MKKFLLSLIALVVTSMFPIAVQAQVDGPVSSTTGTAINVTQSRTLGSDYKFLLDVAMASPSQTLTLPVAPFMGETITLVIDSSSTNDFTIAGNGYNVNGASSVTVPGSTGSGVMELRFCNNAAGVAGWVQTSGAGSGASVGLGGGLRFSTYTLTPANIVALNTGTGVNAFAGVTGKVYVPVAAELIYTEATSPYAAGGAVSLVCQTSGNALTGTVAASQITAATGSTYSLLQPVSAVAAVGDGVNVYNATAAFTKTTATGTVNVGFWYFLK